MPNAPRSVLVYTSLLFGCAQGGPPAEPQVGQRSFAELTQANTSGVILASTQAGADLGARINTANTALGANAGEIWVSNGSGTITSSVSISANHTLRFFTGTYTLSSGVTITLAGDNSAIVGAGEGTVFAVADNTNRIIFSGDRITAADLKITGTYTGAGPTGGVIFAQGRLAPTIRNVSISGGAGVNFNTCTDVRIEGVRVDNMTADSNPISVYQCTGGIITGARISGFATSATLSSPRLINVLNSSRITVSNSVIRGCDLSRGTSAAAFDFSGSSNCNLTGAIAQDNLGADGVLVEACSIGINISGCDASNNGNSAGAGAGAGGGSGLHVFNSLRVYVGDSDFSNNGNYSGARHSGIDLTTSSDVTLSNCNASDNGGEGVGVNGTPNARLLAVTASRNHNNGLLGGPGTGSANTCGLATGTVESTNLQLTGGNFNNNNAGLGGISAQNGIYLADATTAQMIGVTATNNTGVSSNQQYGIRVENTAKITTLTAPMTAGNLTAGVQDSVGASQSWGYSPTFSRLTSLGGNGSFVYCTDCNVANPCTGGGSGAMAKRLNGTWTCF